MLNPRRLPQNRISRVQDISKYEPTDCLAGCLPVPNASGTTWSTVRQLVVSLPGVEESISYETPALKVNRKLFARLHQDGENVVVRIEKKDRAALIRANPAFHVTDHYSGFPYVLVRLRDVSREDLGKALENAWRLVAGKDFADS